jgi:hypothetical protein
VAEGDFVVEGVLLMVIRKTLHAEIIVRAQTKPNPACPVSFRRSIRPERCGLDGASQRAH